MFEQLSVYVIFTTTLWIQSNKRLDMLLDICNKVCVCFWFYIINACNYNERHDIHPLIYIPFLKINTQAHISKKSMTIHVILFLSIHSLWCVRFSKHNRRSPLMFVHHQPKQWNEKNHKSDVDNSLTRNTREYHLSQQLCTVLCTKIPYQMNMGALENQGKTLVN